jgi:hypothetical protein
MVDGGCLTDCGRPTDYATPSAGEQTLSMVAKVKNLRHPIRTVINGQACTLLTIGYVTRALGRSNWTVKNWTKLGLLPPAPFVRRSDDPHLRRRMYPEDFVTCLAEIAGRDYVVRRLDYKDWQRFHDEVALAYDETIAPLLGAGVKDMVSTVNEGERRQAI